MKTRIIALTAALFALNVLPACADVIDTPEEPSPILLVPIVVSVAVIAFVLRKAIYRAVMKAASKNKDKKDE
ncbi:MAG: hypothetical protein IIY74_03710 [Firmicutes bacterium]|nr:hypothetical protein [Bacillota bacterium]